MFIKDYSKATFAHNTQRGDDGTYSVHLTVVTGTTDTDEYAVVTAKGDKTPIPVKFNEVVAKGTTMLINYENGDVVRQENPAKKVTTTHVQAKKTVVSESPVESLRGIR